MRVVVGEGGRSSGVLLYHLDEVLVMTYTIDYYCFEEAVCWLTRSFQIVILVMMRYIPCSYNTFDLI